jgi:vacuolar-type H+-ATPase subunit I/STV1
MNAKWYSMAYGLLVVSVGLWLESRMLVLPSQLFVLTAMALSAPVVLAARSGELRRRWFGIALSSCAVIHAVFVAALSKFLPFSNLSPAIAVGFGEMLILAIVSAKIRSRFGA